MCVLTARLLRDDRRDVGGHGRADHAPRQPNSAGLGAAVLT